MRKKILIPGLIAGALVLGLSLPAYAGGCPGMSKKVGAALSTSSLSTDKKAEVTALRAKGDALHKSGKHGDSVAALKQALAMLGM